MMNFIPKNAFNRLLNSIQQVGLGSSLIKRIPNRYDITGSVLGNNWF